MYSFRKSDADAKAPRVQLMGAGTIFNEVIAAADLLKNDWNVAADLWSVPSFTQLAREGAQVERWNLLPPTEERQDSHATKRLSHAKVQAHASTNKLRGLDAPILLYSLKN